MGKQRKFRSYRRNEAPGFNTSTPRNPVDGQYADLARKGLLPYCALMQVAVEDTHDNYVICRGFDTRNRRFYDYVEGDANKKGIAVSKPYGVRGTFPYEVGEIHAAFLPIYQFTERTEYNQNPGKASTTTGHPADLTEDVEHLSDDNGIHINWMMIGSLGVEQMKPKCRFTATEDLTTSDASCSGQINDDYGLDVGSDQWGSGTEHTTLTGLTFMNLLTHTAGVYEFAMDSGDAGIASYSGYGTTWFIDIPECP